MREEKKHDQLAFGLTHDLPEMAMERGRNREEPLSVLLINATGVHLQKNNLGKKETCSGDQWRMFRYSFSHKFHVYFRGFSIAMFDYQRVLTHNPECSWN